MISEGIHPAVSDGYQWGKANSGNRQIVVNFKIIDGPFAGHNISWFGFFTEKTFARTMEALRFCGWKGDNLDDLGVLDQQVQLVVEHDSYEGKTRAKVAWVNRPGGGQIKLKDPMSMDEIRAFAASMKAKAAGIKEVDGESVDVGSVAAATTPPPDGNNGVSGGDLFATDDTPPAAYQDDIPF